MPSDWCCAGPSMLSPESPIEAETLRSRFVLKAFKQEVKIWSSSVVHFQASVASHHARLKSHLRYILPLVHHSFFFSFSKGL